VARHHRVLDEVIPVVANLVEVGVAHAAVQDVDENLCVWQDVS
jgi:hypothetical protein